MAADLVSVVVPSFNKADYIGETLDSVLTQQGVPVEIIVVDDASTDGSWDIIREYADRRADRITARRLPRNRGAPHVRNQGSRMAEGEYLMFLDADDILAPGTLASLVQALRDRIGCVAACRWKQMRREGEEWVTVRPTKPLFPADGDAVRAWLTDNWYFPPCAVLWPRTLYEQSSGWDEDLQVLQDADLMVQTLLRGTEIVLAKGGEARYRVHAAGESLSKISSEATVRSRIRFLDKVAQRAGELGLLQHYRRTLGQAYYTLARAEAQAYPHLESECLRKVDRHVGRSPFSGTPLHRFLWKVLGLQRKERLTRWFVHRGLPRRAGAADAGSQA